MSVVVGARSLQAAVSRNELDEFIEAEMQGQSVPGLAACIVKSGRIVWSKGYGWSSVKRRVATHAASHLAQEHRLDADPYEVVEVQGGDGIGKMRSRLDGEGRVLFLIHDPWGMFEADDRAQEWASELPKLARRASVGRKFLITSRTAIKEEHVPAEFRNVLTAADIAITEANYSDADREAILRHALRGAGPLHMDFAARHRQRILAQLRLPLAIDAFAQGLMTCSVDPEPSLEELIRSSNVEAIGQKIQEEVEARGEDAVAGAVVLWSLF
jgi:hypothetical protein